MASSSSSAQERSIASPKLYDAFISYRGFDVKHTLAKELYEQLQKRGCRSFLDRPEIQLGDFIPAAIYNAICSSRVQIAIFSHGYAESSWCLDELVLMLQQTDALFIPVFYDVRPWELRYIEKSQYAEAFSCYARRGRYLDKLDEWKNALKSAADISGYELSQYQDNLCEKIVSRVLQEKEKSIPLHVAKYHVGLVELVQDFERSCSKTGTVVGIFGLGGSGKTTLAKELFIRRRSGYHTSCFLSDVRESHARGELHCLQSQLCKNLFPGDKINIRCVDQGIGVLKDRLGRARHLHFLIILDDVDHEHQLDALLPEGVLGSGSLVIITTRNQSVLMNADTIYKMKGIDKDHAKDLFCSHAFRGRDPPSAYAKLVESFVNFCGGLPLSLIVLGAHVYGRDEHYWELELNKVMKTQPRDLMQTLKISFEGLDIEEKQIFMDIACLFNKKELYNLKSKAIAVWKASGWNAEHAIQTLQDKSLLEVLEHGNFQRFEMHDRLRDLGRQIADELGPPRLWRPDILMEAKGFKQILAETKGRCFHSFWDSSLRCEITYFIGSSNDSAETELLWLETGNLESIPAWIPLGKLQCLSVCGMEELWSTFQQQLQTNTQASFELRVLNIFDSPSLQNLPDLIGMFSHLEELRIIGSLKRTDRASLLQSLAQLSNLRVLEGENLLAQLCNLRVLECENLNLSKAGDSTDFDSSKSSRVISLETTIHLYYLVNMSKLLLMGKNYPRVQSLKVELMENLYEMDLKQLNRLNTLEVWGCPKLETISGLSALTGLQSLKIRTCPKLETISGLSCLMGLQVLCTEKCEGLKSIETLAQLHGLEQIHISECHQLQDIGGLEELQGLKSLLIEVPHNGDASVWNWIHGLKRLPSEYTILTGETVYGALSILNVKLFSDIKARGHSVAENQNHMKLEGSLNAITMYALIVHGEILSICVNGSLLLCLRDEGERMVIVLINAHDSIVCIGGVTIVKGFKATVNKGQEWKALRALRRIVDRLYRRRRVPIRVPMLADVVKPKRKRNIE